MLNHSLVQHYYLCKITKIAFWDVRKLCSFTNHLISLLVVLIVIRLFLESANDQIDSLILAMAFDSNPIKQHWRIAVNEIFFGMENHSASGFEFAWKSHNRKDYDKRINPYLFLFYKGFGKIFLNPHKDRITAFVDCGFFRKRIKAA